MKNRLASIAVAAGIAAAISPTFADNAANVSPAERAKIEGVVHQYLLKNPQVIVEVIQILQKKQADQAQQTVQETKKVAASFAKALFHVDNDPMAGNPNGKVTVVEFFDYQCPHCVDMAPVIDSIIKANPDVRVVFKEFPIRGPMSEAAARAALAANMQGKYLVFSHAILNANKPLTDEFILETAKNAGLDVDKLKKDMNSKAVKDQLEANIKLAKDLKLIGTPAIFVGKSSASGKDPINYIPGQADPAQLQGVINQAKQ